MNSLHMTLIKRLGTLLGMSETLPCEAVRCAGHETRSGVWAPAQTAAPQTPAPLLANEVLSSAGSGGDCLGSFQSRTADTQWGNAGGFAPRYVFVK